ncbi:MAG: 3-phosphoshikimate 1-carboxyvinyltransferase [Planctomycetes bacterium]|nr:3-phosphoshikimate 1-carboxyvinyltransferase [Planctomycetota bacterium]
MTEPRPLPALELPFDLDVDLPGSKSEANRALVLASLAQGVTRLEGATLGDDVLYMAEGLIALGFDLDIVDADRGLIDVVGGLPTVEEEAQIYCGNAGTVLRFLISVAALVPGQWRLTGDAQLKKRPIAPLLEAWRSLGLEIRDCDGGLPVTIVGGKVRGGRVRLDSSSSSQFLSSLLLVGSALDGGLEVQIDGPLASPDYVDLTIETMARFGLRVHRQADLLRVTPSRGLSPGQLAIEGDWSAAGAFLVLAEMTASRFRGRNLRSASHQADRLLPDLIAGLRAPGELEIDLGRTPDQLMNLAILAARRAGSTRFTGVANLRLKECDRLAVTARELGRAGIEATVTEDGLLIAGGGEPRPCVFEPEDDHRLAMALALIASMRPGFAVRQRRCVAKSYPAFFEHLRQARSNHRAIALVGMRAAGKSRLARELGARLAIEVVDSDEIFVRERGAIADFVARSGWPAFRELEATIIARELRSGRVLALGGGALESEATRDLLREAAIVVHLDEDLATIRERIGRDGDRPSLTGRGSVEELDEVHARRRPVYADAARLTVPPGLGTEAQVDFVQKELRRLCSW